MKMETGWPGVTSPVPGSQKVGSKYWKCIVAQICPLYTQILLFFAKLVLNVISWWGWRAVTSGVMLGESCSLNPHNAFWVLLGSAVDWLTRCFPEACRLYYWVFWHLWPRLGSWCWLRPGDSPSGLTLTWPCPGSYITETLATGPDASLRNICHRVCFFAQWWALWQAMGAQLSYFLLFSEALGA